MEIIDVPIKSLKPYKRNPRKNDKAVEYVANSIRQFGFKVPIVIDENYEIVCGHTRWKAAKVIGLDSVPCIMADDLTPDQIKVFRLSDNKTAEMADWDFDLLELEFNDIDPDLFDMADFGFFHDEEQEEQKPTEVTEDDFDESTVTESVCKRGQVWQLGEHRLMCGDSTSAEDVARLMNSEKADMVVTSPPYGKSGSTKLRDHYVKGAEERKSLYIEHADGIGGWKTLIDGAFENMRQWTKAQFINIQMLADNKRDLIRFLNDNVSHLCDVIVWDKQKAPPQMEENVLNNEYEFVFVFAEDNATRVVPFSDFHGNINNVIHMSVGQNEFADVHRAVFPVAFPAEIMKIASKAKAVLDLFGGTGTTMIAAEQLDRKCFMMEISPRYCDVIIKRWEDFTGKKAELLEE